MFYTIESDERLADKFRLRVYQKEHGLMQGNVFANEFLYEETPGAKRYLRYFPDDVVRTLRGEYSFDYIGEEYQLPRLKIKPLMDLLEEMRAICRNEHEYNLDTNFNNTLAWLLCNISVCLVTVEDEGREVTVHNIFDGIAKKIKVPKSLSFEEAGSDALGMYLHKTGSILLWVDKIYEHRIAPILFQKVLLHELIHAMFDVEDKNPKSLKRVKIPEEETFDNLLVLYTYAISKPNSKEFEMVRDFIKRQPAIYSAAVTRFDKAINDPDGWCNARKDIIEMLLKKI